MVCGSCVNASHAFFDLGPKAPSTISPFFYLLQNGGRHMTFEAGCVAGVSLLELLGCKSKLVDIRISYQTLHIRHENVILCMVPIV